MTATKLAALGVPIALLVLVLVLVASGGSPAAPPPTDEVDGGVGATGGTRHEADAVARLKDAEGNFVGVVRFRYEGDEVEVEADLKNVEPADEFHGFHVHQTGKCDPEAVDPATGNTVPFFSAGGTSIPVVRPMAITRATSPCCWSSRTVTPKRSSTPIASDSGSSSTGTVAR